MPCGSLSIEDGVEELVVRYEGSIPHPTPVTYI